MRRPERNTKKPAGKQRAATEIIKKHGKFYRAFYFLHFDFKLLARICVYENPHRVAVAIHTVEGIAQPLKAVVGAEHKLRILYRQIVGNRRRCRILADLRPGNLPILVVGIILRCVKGIDASVICRNRNLDTVVFTQNTALSAGENRGENAVAAA